MYKISLVDTCHIEETLHCYKYWPLFCFPLTVSSVTQVPKAITNVYSRLSVQACCIATAHLHEVIISNMQDVIYKFRDRFCNFINGRSWGVPLSWIVPLSLLSPQQEGRPENFNFKQCLSSFGQTSMRTDAFDVCVTAHH